MDNIQIKTGRTAQDFWKIASKKALVRRGNVASKHSEMLAWLKSKEIGLGHVHATSSYCICDCVQTTRNLAFTRENGLVARGIWITKNKICVVLTIPRRVQVLNENGNR